MSDKEWWEEAEDFTEWLDEYYRRAGEGLLTTHDWHRLPDGHAVKATENGPVAINPKIADRYLQPLKKEP